MKLVIAILRDMDTDAVSKALTTSGFRVTQVASSGGFLRRGMTTLLIGLEDDQVDTALDQIRQNLAPAQEANQKRGTIFVLPVDHYVHY
jgi:uncharacterized protein YaaQ